MNKEDIIKKIELLLHNKKEFQKWALPTYVKHYYSYDKIVFDKLKHPPKVKKIINLNTLLNFDAHYYLFEDDGFKKRWKLNFLIANTCVRNVLKEILIQLKNEMKE